MVAVNARWLKRQLPTGDLGGHSSLLLLSPCLVCQLKYSACLTRSPARLTLCRPGFRTPYLGTPFLGTAPRLPRGRGLSCVRSPAGPLSPARARRLLPSAPTFPLSPAFLPQLTGDTADPDSSSWLVPLLHVDS